MGCTTLLSSMTHGLYNSYTIHAPWVVQYSYYPWVMGCTTLLSPMLHGLYNNPSTHGPWIIQCLYYLCSIEYILKFIQPQHNLI